MRPLAPPVVGFVGPAVADQRGRLFVVPAPRRRFVAEGHADGLAEGVVEQAFVVGPPTCMAKRDEVDGVVCCFAYRAGGLGRRHLQVGPLDMVSRCFDGWFGVVPPSLPGVCCRGGGQSAERPPRMG